MKIFSQNALVPFVSAAIFVSLAGGEARASDFQSKVIYGDDDRVEFFSASRAQQELMLSTAAVLPASKLVRSETGSFRLQTQSLGSRLNLCSGEAFAAQPSAPNCSAFLVGPDLLATAGHCISASSCAQTKFIFDFMIKNENTEAPREFNDSQIYSCLSVLAREETASQDYALIRLDRAVVGRAPLKLSAQTPVSNARLFVVGNPMGLPTKLAGNAIVRQVQPRFFQANLDTYGGNSGSAVFNEDSHEVEGILVRGEEDFAWKGNCRISNVCATTECSGEDVSLIADIRRHL